MVKRILKWLGVLVVIALVVGGGFVVTQVMAFNGSVSKKYDIPLPTITRSTDPAVLERGKHLVQSVAGCGVRDCHGNDLSSGPVTDIGPVGSMQAQNITPAGVVKDYSDGELARLLLHGVKRDGTTIKMMPVPDFNWLPDDDIVAIISYVRSVPPVQKESQGFQPGILGKILDRQDKFPIDIARRIDHEHRIAAPSPAPTTAYGSYVARLCQGCHGEHLSGGPIPGAPPSIPIPRNITPDDTGIKAYTFEDFNKLLDTGVRKNGEKLNPFMPYEALSHMNPTERTALWAFLRSVEPRKAGGR
jgi:hypothetical protein